ncbi:glycoside hydrolase [Cantharellus anzutake]|uniref:glycoside hydrolase n=1 Tax=Cantharellus anzutake TaxID=1750568 RepID=UPI001903003B|nr:glycoside hydrolase [Cantharellus anzutake]KAF8321394.1 glycoside hydrolase [Cantharellus anzutake]
MSTARYFVNLLTALSLSPSPKAPSHLKPSSSLLGTSFIANDAKSCTSNDSRWQFPPSLPVTVPQPQQPDQKISTIYRYRQQQGVNLGSWFVLEGWMHPSLFACASGPQSSEYDFASGFGWNQTLTKLVLENHWDTFITEQDFVYLASIGINTVRLPIGYWSLGPDGGWMDGTPFESVKEVYTGSWPRVLRAIGTAEKYGIGILIDLHGAPGSQNGQSHSGTSDGKVGLFGNECYMNKTTDILAYLAKQLVNRNNVVGIQLLNEPNNDARLPDFYAKTIDALRSISPATEKFPFYIHDAFNVNQYGNFVSDRTDFVVEDHHSYFVYTPSDQSASATSHTNDINSGVLKSLTSTSELGRRNMIIGEWSCALTPQSLSMENHPSDSQRTFCEGQMNIYSEAAAGWTFWSYNKEDCGDDGGWCFRKAVGTNLPSTFYSFPQSQSNNTAATLLRTSMIAGSSSSNDLDPILGCIRPASSPSLPTIAATSQKSIARGYADGFSTAKVFAQNGLSKLGFRGQYIRDHYDELLKDSSNGMSSDAANRDQYSTWFLKGLKDAEAQISAFLNGQPVVYPDP